MKIKFKKFTKEAKIPVRASLKAAAFDLSTIQDGAIFPEGTTSFDTGIAVEIPDGYVGLVFGRSGWAFKDAVQLCNAVGVIDSDFRDSIKVGLVSHDNRHSKFVQKGERIGQLMIIKTEDVEWEEVQELTKTERGTGGLGSTGKASIEDLLRV